MTLVKKSEKLARIRPAREISLVTISMLDDFVKAFTIGKNERVANAGASSVLVYMILAVLLILLVVLKWY